MKKILFTLLFGCCVVLMSGCSETDFKSTSVIPDPTGKPTQFDTWLDTYYRASYNIRYLYKYEHIESDMSYDVVPAKELYSKIIAKMIQFLWLDAYTEVAGFSFMRHNAPRVLHVIGSGSYLGNNLRLGTAEGGVKISIYVGNWISDMASINYNNGIDESEGFSITSFDIDNINAYYLHTIHHEFSHILDQNKRRPTEFNTISAENYTANWNNIETYAAIQLGFVSKYGSSSADEDFAEIFSTYLTTTDEEWNSILAIAGEKGAPVINEKLSLIKNYTKDSWGLDLDKLRNVLIRRYQELENLDWDNFEL